MRRLAPTSATHGAALRQMRRPVAICRPTTGPGLSRPGRRVTVLASINWSHRQNERAPRAENVPGAFFVDRTCIDCDTCRWMAPDTFARVGSQSAVVTQPGDRAGRVAALRALLSCPTYSIHVTDRTPDELREAQDGLPARVPGLPPPTTAGAGPRGSEGLGGGGGGGGPAPRGPTGVYYTGWASEKSFAGCAYLIVRPEGGNILVDSPRFNPVLARRMEALGGVRFMFLTHRDDVGDHEAWARRFGATRILHEGEVAAHQGTDKVEVKLSGPGPWVLGADGAIEAIASGSCTAPGSDTATSASVAAPSCPDVTFILTPGHTQAHVCMYYAPYKALFSGDHLSSPPGDVEPAQQDQLYIFTDFNWYSVPEQLRSVAKLLQYDWLHVLPAHGRRVHLADATARLAAVSNLLRKHGVKGATAADSGTRAPASSSSSVLNGTGAVTSGDAARSD